MPVLVDLSKLSDVVKMFNKIPDTSGLVKKTDYDAKITEIEGKIPAVSNLATKTALITLENKILDVTNLATKTALTTLENKIPNVTNLATKTTLTVVENKISDVSSLVKKTDYNTRVAEIDTKVSSLDGNIAENKTKNESIENELKEVTKNLLLFL